MKEKKTIETGGEREGEIRGVTFVLFLFKIFVLNRYKYLSLLPINLANEDKIKREEMIYYWQI